MIILDEYIRLSKEERQQHLNLDEMCLERGGNSTNHRGVLSQFLDTNIPGHKILLAHACNNAKCSNPRHLYWSTHRENTVEDGAKFGTWKNPWERSVEKYGLEEAKRRNIRGDKAKGGKNNAGKPKSEEHKKKISEALKNKRITPE
jgi:hypothetical protein